MFQCTKCIYLCAYVLLFRSFAHCSTVPYTNIVNVTQLPKTSGLYYQYANNAKFVEDVWHFIVEVNHYDIFDSLRMTQKEIHSMVKMLNGTDFNECKQIVNIARLQFTTYITKRLQTLQDKHNMLDQSVLKVGDYEDHETLLLSTKAPSFNNAKRRKRGVFNFVGSIHKFLFGVMDSNDAQELHELAKNSNALNVQVKMINNELIDLVKYVDKKDCIEKEHSDKCAYITAKTSFITEHLNEMEKIYDRLERAVHNAKNNELDTFVLTPKALLEQLQNVRLPSGLYWPVDLNLKNVQLLIDNIVHTHVFITSDRTLLFYIEVPLIDSTVYKMYQIVSIPFCDANNKCALILPETKYLGITKDDQRSYIRKDDDERISKLGDDTWLCYKPEIIYDSNQATLCDIKIFLKSSAAVDYERDCDIRIGKFEKEIFYPIADYNQWLYVLHSDTEIIFNCWNNNINEEIVVEPMIIPAGTGIIDANGDNTCKLITKRTKLTINKLKNHLTNTLKGSINNSFNLSAALRNIDEMKMHDLKVNIDLNHNNLKHMTQRLVDLRKSIENNTVFKDDEINDEIESQQWFCNVIGWLGIDCHVVKSIIVCIVFAFVLLFSYKIYNCFCANTCTELCSKCSTTTRKRRQPANIITMDHELEYMNKPTLLRKRADDYDHDDDDDVYVKHKTVYS
ncbi:F protein [Urbanus proteus nucleopolyhedrovirus]|uniref:F protein n=1 Tax=Urbanus proteus nucleopolyhedrovirus TaxID=1675866 RepID=A0A161C6Z5_9ABAC|nr:F protein [Urbanus proteus nucleopolyhedrovirus]AKR17392.1 F protein [Urbanus proteus nucleopolyhedrovirus]